MSRNIVCISTNYWHDFRYRKQHFMWRFAHRGNKILYVEPSFSLVRRPYAYKRVYAHHRFFKSTVEKVHENIFLLKPPKGLPYWSHPFISTLNHRWFGKIVDQKVRELGFKDYILWIYRPEYYNALSLLSCDKVVFDLTDDLAAYRGKKDSQYFYMRRCIGGLMKRSNLVFTTAKTLYKKYSTIYGEDKVYYTPNGFDAGLFSKNNYELPEDMGNIPKPIIGFVGLLFKFLDYDLIGYVAEKNPNKSVVLIGPVEPSAEKYVEKLKKYKNIYLLGKKPRGVIPSYIHSFDICINPFKIDEVSRSANPLKIYEYLACGKPVVSIVMESLKSDKLISNEIDFAADYLSFDKLIKKRMAKEVSREEKIRKIRVVQNYSWDRLFHKLLIITQEHGLHI